ncbi:MAG: hypothetical protein LQ343_008023 [Gyalolechia ehrenbergii]|nr:MAG: hypothetical protein LQ343_008023 [Gyalolechia ehrenbergii]
MAEYHTLLKKLEELVQPRIELIGDGSRHGGVDKSINVKFSKLRQENSLPARAEDYCRRLKIVRQQLGGYAMGDMDSLIAKQESLLPEVRPNVGKLHQPRSPKLSPPLPPLVRPQRRSNNPVNAAATPRIHWGNPPAAPAGIQNQPNAPNPQAAPALPIPGAWPAAPTQPQPTYAPSQQPGFPREPPALYINILSLSSKEKACRNSNRHQPLSIKCGGSSHEDTYSGFTHWLLAFPSRIGIVMWSPRSHLIIIQSAGYVPYVAGDMLHMEVYSMQEAGRFVNYLRQWYANGNARVAEVPV